METREVDVLARSGIGRRARTSFDKYSQWAAISPDGKLVALRYFDDQSNTNKVAVVSFAGGEPLKNLEVSTGFRDVGLGWTADSRSTVYADTWDNADNVWSLPIDSVALPGN